MSEYSFDAVIAVSRVQAGVKGKFGLVLGIAREDNEDELKRNGADKVIKDFSEITIDYMEKWFVEKTRHTVL